MFYVKKYFHLTTIFCFLTLSLCSQYPLANEVLNKKPLRPVKDDGKQELVSAQDKPQISFSSISHDVGEVYEGAEVVHTFTVKNIGTAQLEINNVKAGWGCTVASFDKAIPPGQEGKVTLKIDTKNKKGRLNQSATIFSNDLQNPETKITITGSIKQYITIEPSARVLLQGYTGEKVEKKVTITSFEEQPLKITGITSTIEDKIKYKFRTIEKGKVYSLEVKTRSGIKESFQGKITLQTNSQKKPEVEITIIGKVSK